MGKKYPILMVIPHGGYKVPEELSETVALNDFQIFMEADTCANEIFNMRNIVSATIDSQISRFFIDTDRSYLSLPPKHSDGVVKTSTLRAIPVFKEGYYPDEIAISAILKRYYMPFHETMDKILATGDIALILSCHTVMPIGPKMTADYNSPRPIVSIENTANIKGETVKTCPDNMATAFLKAVAGEFAKDGSGINNPFTLKNEPTKSYIAEKYQPRRIPILRLNLSKALFLNEKHFSSDSLKVDENRLADINSRLVKAIGRFGRAIFES